MSMIISHITTTNARFLAEVMEESRKNMCCIFSAELLAFSKALSRIIPHIQNIKIFSDSLSALAAIINQYTAHTLHGRIQMRGLNSLRVY